MNKASLKTSAPSLSSSTIPPSTQRPATDDARLGPTVKLEAGDCGKPKSSTSGESFIVTETYLPDITMDPHSQLISVISVEVVKLLKRGSKWFLVKTAFGQEGWVPINRLQLQKGKQVKMTYGIEQVSNTFVLVNSDLDTSSNVPNPKHPAVRSTGSSLDPISLDSEEELRYIEPDPSSKNTSFTSNVANPPLSASDLTTLKMSDAAKSVTSNIANLPVNASDPTTFKSADAAKSVTSNFEEETDRVDIFSMASLFQLDYDLDTDKPVGDLVIAPDLTVPEGYVLGSSAKSWKSSGIAPLHFSDDQILRVAPMGTLIRNPPMIVEKNHYSTHGWRRIRGFHKELPLLVYHDYVDTAYICRLIEPSLSGGQKIQT